MSDPIQVTREGHIAHLVLNRPDAYNAMNLELMERLTATFTALAVDDTVRGVVVSGAGKAFCAGGDLKWALSFPGGPPTAFHTLAARFHAAVLEIRRMPKPVIAAINGVAAGGGFSLALACDFRVMAAGASMKQAYTSSGLCIDGGGTFALPRLVGFARALEIAAFDETIPAAQALEWGLVTKIVDDGRAVAEATEMAQALAQRSLESYAVSKRLLLESFDTSLETQLERERAGLAHCAATPDGREGLQAFVEKRTPNFVTQ